MKLFTGKIEVKETDTIKVNQYYLEVFDKNCNRTYYEDSNYWSKREFDKNGNEKYFENSKGDWEKREYDENNNRTYFENSNGKIIDNRLKQLTIEEQKKKDELLDLYRLLIELKEIVAFEVRLFDREKAIQDILDISIRIYLIETGLKGE